MSHKLTNEQRGDRGARILTIMRMKVLADPNTTHTVRHNATRWHDALTGIMNMLGDRVEVRR